MSRLNPAAAICVAAVVTACAGSDDPVTCPAARTVPDAGRLVDFAGDTETPRTKRFAARIDALRLSCERVERNDQPAVAARVKLRLVTEKGPALKKKSIAYRYFVAVVTNDGTVIARKAFPVKIAAKGNATTLRTTQTLSPAWPLGTDKAPADYTVYVGFELSKQQVRYNRANPT